MLELTLVVFLLLAILPSPASVAAQAAGASRAI